MLKIKKYVKNFTVLMCESATNCVISFVCLQTFWEIAMASASNTLNTLAVKPSPRSLASQHLQAKIYLTPLVGTATASSSTSQQLSGVAPSWPSCREGKEQSLHTNKAVFFQHFDSCVGVHGSAHASVKL